MGEGEVSNRGLWERVAALVFTLYDDERNYECCTSQRPPFLLGPLPLLTLQLVSPPVQPWQLGQGSGMPDCADQVVPSQCPSLGVVVLKVYGHMDSSRQHHWDFWIGCE